MAVNKCTTCFYAEMDKDLEAPCASCSGYSNWVPMTMYAPNQGPQTLKEAIDDWFTGTNGVTQEDFWTTPDPQYNVVSKPKHYMLFDADYVNSTAYLKEGIEVRDVIERLVWKVKMDTGRNVPDWEMAPMFDSDYTQMMQYLMRFMDKNGVEDLKKARWYLDKLIDSYDKSDI
jgi:hypothetical protein